MNYLLAFACVAVVAACIQSLRDDGLRPLSVAAVLSALALIALFIIEAASGSSHTTMRWYATGAIGGVVVVGVVGSTAKLSRASLRWLTFAIALSAAVGGALLLIMLSEARWFVITAIAVFGAIQIALGLLQYSWFRHESDTEKLRNEVAKRHENSHGDTSM